MRSMGSRYSTMQCSAGMTDQRASLLDGECVAGIAAISTRISESSCGHKSLRYSAVDATVASKTVALVRSNGNRGPVTAARIPRP